MSVIIHSTKPKGQPAGVGFENSEPQLGKTLKNPSEDKMTEGGHVIAGKSQGMIEATESKLYIFSPLAFKVSKRMKTPLSILAVGRDGKIQLASEIPKRIVLWF